MNIQTLLSRYPNEVGLVRFVKKDGTIRSMRFKRGVIGGTTPLKGGKWANGHANPEDYGIINVTDLELEEKEEYSRRSFKEDTVIELQIGGETWTKNTH